MGWPNDGVAAFFLVCFFIGLIFTVMSFLLGLGHGTVGEAAHGHFDGGHGHFGGGHAHGGGHIHVGGAEMHAGHAHAGGAGVHAAGDQAGTGSAVKAQLQHGGPSFFNLSTLMAFLTWFGGAGYILQTYYTAGAVAALLLASLAGLAGAALVFAFLSRILYASERVLDPRDYYLPGTLARVTSPIRAGGVGEIVYSKGETRQVAGARSVDGSAIERETEVVIMRYERGLAYVQPWDDLMREEQSGEQPTPAEP
jgi:membrane protein implicated in regulation of membrane protease activity